jgi:hypothetical protein
LVGAGSIPESHTIPISESAAQAKIVTNSFNFGQSILFWIFIITQKFPKLFPVFFRVGRQESTWNCRQLFSFVACLWRVCMLSWDCCGYSRITEQASTGMRCL